jgi:hypothetical protein
MTSTPLRTLKPLRTPKPASLPDPFALDLRPRSRQIVEADTTLGKIRAEHRPTGLVAGGPRGIRVDNQIWLTLTPESPIGFDDGIERVLILLNFITFAVGRKQRVPTLFIDVGTRDKPRRLKVHWSHYPRPPEKAGCGAHAPHPADLPFDPIQRREEFVSVVKSWLGSEEARGVARTRIHDCFAQQSCYSVDRLVGAANAYDHLPESAVLPAATLSEEILNAKKQCKDLFRPLLKGSERDALFQAFGRIGEPNLKQKVRHRAALINAVAAAQFPSLDEVCDHAIDCRNYFVHGNSRMKFDLNEPPDTLGFLTDTLEFVFIASDFIEAGWDIKRFLATPTSMSHPFGDYLVCYAVHLRGLQDSCARWRARQRPTDGDPD